MDFKKLFTDAANAAIVAALIAFVQALAAALTKDKTGL